MTRREEIARALCRLKVMHNLRFDKEPREADFVDRCIDAGWNNFTDEADAILSLPPEEPVTSELAAKLRKRLDSASPGDRQYERPMNWSEADELLAALTLHEAEIARLKADLKLLEGEVDCHAEEEIGFEHDLMQERARAETAEQARDEALKALDDILSEPDIANVQTRFLEAGRRLVKGS